MAVRDPNLSTEAFCAAFVSALVSDGITTIRPRSDAARRGFQSVIASLDKAIRAASDKGDRDNMYGLLKIRTDLAPSSNGAYDNFESCLRSLQTSLVSSPNPAFADLRFNVSQSYAKGSRERLNPLWARLAETAARAFEGPASAAAGSDGRQHQISIS
jgi:hypothetical protein